MKPIGLRIAKELGIGEQQVAAAISLLDCGATVPFVARYRKEAAAALEGARAILIERFTEDATLIGTLREEVWSRGRLCSRVRTGKAEPGAKFADYFDFSEGLAKLPSHRILALFRGEKEEVLTLELVPDPAASDRGEQSAFERRIGRRFKINDHWRPGERWLTDTGRLEWRDRRRVPTGRV